VVVLRDGRSVAELAGDAVTPDAIMDAMAHGSAVEAPTPEAAS
jgi:ABC-type sugar transport system ATPase subunit